MRYLTSLALLAVAAAPVALAFDETSLVQATVFARENFLETFLEADVGLTNLTQYGDPIRLTVRPVSGDDLPVRFRSGMRLHVLMRSVCSKLGLEVASAIFTKKGRQLDPASTATAFGLSDGDVVEVSTPDLLREAAEARNRAFHAGRRSDLARQLQEEREQRDAIRTEKRRKVALKVARRVADEKRRHRMELKDEITLKFVRPAAGEDVYIGVKRANWLEGYLELVAKRMGLNRTKAVFIFKDDEGAPSAIEPHDSVITLGLEDGESIAVKVPRKH